MRGEEARLLLGFPPNSRLTLSQLKAAYRRKAWESHPDRFPVHAKPDAESKFKLTFLLNGDSKFQYLFLRDRVFILDLPWIWISEAYNLLLDGFEGEISGCFTLKRESSRRFIVLKGFPAGARGESSSAATYTRIVKTGVPNVHRGRSNGALIGIPFLLIVGGTIGIGAVHAYRAYEKEKQVHPSHNPFLP